MAMPKIQVLLTNLTRLSKREKTILYLVAVFVSLALLDRLIISPILYKIRSLDGELHAREAQIRKDMRMIAQKDRILAESEKYTPYLRSAASEEEEMTAILKEIEGLANRSSVYIVDMKPGGVKSAGESKKFVVSLNCEAQMDQIAEFMYQIESSTKLLAIEKYQINPKSKESSIAKCSMTITKVAML